MSPGFHKHFASCFWPTRRHNGCPIGRRRRDICNGLWRFLPQLVDSPALREDIQAYRAIQATHEATPSSFELSLMTRNIRNSPLIMRLLEHAIIPMFEIIVTMELKQYRSVYLRYMAYMVKNLNPSIMSRKLQTCTSDCN
jgi:hypothetical protein